jgi:haloalkane dehalogenase
MFLDVMAAVFGARSMIKRNAAVAMGAAAAGTVLVTLATDHWNLADPADDLIAKGFVREDIATPTGRMTYFQAGNGEPLVFLHGIGGGASSWTWIRVAPSFVERHKVVVADWVGWGSSEHPRRFLEFADYERSLEDLLELIGAPVTIVAQSLSAGFAMSVAERRPELVRRLIFNTPSGGRDFGGNAFGILAKVAIEPAARLPLIGRGFYKALFHRSQFIGGWLRQEGFADASAVTREIVDAFLYNARRKNAAYSALPFATGGLRYDIAPYFDRLETPASMFWGSEETQVGVEVAHKLIDLRPDVPCEFIDHTKACPELERPERVVKVIDRAIRTT